MTDNHLLEAVDILQGFARMSLRDATAHEDKAHDLEKRGLIHSAARERSHGETCREIARIHKANAAAHLARWEEANGPR